MHLFVDLHACGLHRTLGLSDHPVVLGGFSADALLKGFYASAKRSPESRKGWEGGPLRTDLLDVVRERRRDHRELLRKVRPGSAGEETMLWPFSMRRAGAHHDGNRRLFPTWEVFHSTGVLDVASRSPLGWKRNRKLFLRAVRPFLARTRFLPHTSSLRFPGLPRPVSLAVALPPGLARGGMSLVRGGGRSHGPWPSMSRLANTLASRERGATVETPDPLLRELFSGEAEAVEREVTGWHVLHRLALLQLRQVIGLGTGPLSDPVLPQLPRR
ncbi:MAG: hypothetical protein WEG36_02095 [Gemmatimonadota bacterium]